MPIWFSVRFNVRHQSTHILEIVDDFFLPSVKFRETHYRPGHGESDMESDAKSWVHVDAPFSWKRIGQRIGCKNVRVDGPLSARYPNLLNHCKLMAHEVRYDNGLLQLSWSSKKSCGIRKEWRAGLDKQQSKELLKTECVSWIPECFTKWFKSYIKNPVVCIQWHVREKSRHDVTSLSWNNLK
jgi:hypothetical protein